MSDLAKLLNEANEQLAAAQKRLAEVERLAAAAGRDNTTLSDKLYRREQERDALRARCAGMREAYDIAVRLVTHVTHAPGCQFSGCTCGAAKDIVNDLLDFNKIRRSVAALAALEPAA